MSALEQLPFDHALELLEATNAKYLGGNLKDPSNYIIATVNRGHLGYLGLRRT